MSLPAPHILQPIAHLNGRDEPTDGNLLEQFIDQKDDTAFTLLMSRHGRMVYAMARRLLKNPADADDVCQAAFLLLARKAPNLERQRSIAGWLVGVIRKLSADVRKMQQRRSRHEHQAATSDIVLDSSLLAASREIGQQIDEALARLPRKYREPLLLCYWEGLSKAQATERLGWKPGTFSGRLARGKSLLKLRLERKGILPSVILAWFSGAGISQALPTLVTSQVARQAMIHLPGIQSLTSATIFHLVQGAVRSMFFTQMKYAAACIAAVACLGLLGAGAFSLANADDRGSTPASTRSVQSGPSDQDKIQGKWHCVALAMGGAIPEEARKNADAIRDMMWMEFKGDKVNISGSPAEKDPAKYTLVTTANPKQIVIDAGQMKLRGIYTLEDGLLVFRYAENASKEDELPKSFALGAKSTGILFVMQRDRSGHQGTGNTKGLLGAVAQSTPMAVAENHMKQIALAVHNYAADHNALPDNVYDKNGKAILSWRVKLLPYIDSPGSAELAKKFKMDDPWDSDHNKELLSQMPLVFSCPTAPAAPTTYTTPFRAFMGKDTLHAFNRKFKFSDIKDGTSNTFLFVEAAEEVPWTSPNDLVYDREQPFPKVGGRFGNTFFAAFCDGFVRPLTVYPNKVNLNVVPYFYMVTPAGAERIEPDAVKP